MKAFLITVMAIFLCSSCSKEEKDTNIDQIVIDFSKTENHLLCGNTKDYQGIKLKLRPYSDLMACSNIYWDEGYLASGSLLTIYFGKEAPNVSKISALLKTNGTNLTYLKIYSKGKVISEQINKINLWDTPEEMIYENTSFIIDSASLFTYEGLFKKITLDFK
jgi:ABC-type metal ion transport system substrate-binding protein